MSNQVISWSFILIPWLTLLFMKKEEVKRFMPVALFTVVTSTVIYELGTTYKLWSIREAAYPLHQMFPAIYGAFPVLVMWIFRFTFGSFWSYLATNAVIDIVWAYILFPWFVRIGVLEFLNAKTLIYSFTVGHAILLYGYQMWQEDTLVPALKKVFFPIMRPAATKPVFKEDNDKTDNQ